MSMRSVGGRQTSGLSGDAVNDAGEAAAEASNVGRAAGGVSTGAGGAASQGGGGAGAARRGGGGPTGEATSSAMSLRSVGRRQTSGLSGDAVNDASEAAAEADTTDIDGGTGPALPEGVAIAAGANAGGGGGMINGVGGGRRGETAASLCGATGGGAGPSVGRFASVAGLPCARGGGGAGTPDGSAVAVVAAPRSPEAGKVGRRSVGGGFRHCRPPDSARNLGGGSGIATGDVTGDAACTGGGGASGSRSSSTPGGRAEDGAKLESLALPAPLSSVALAACGGTEPICPEACSGLSGKESGFSWNHAGRRSATFATGFRRGTAMGTTTASAPGTAPADDFEGHRDTGAEPLPQDIFDGFLDPTSDAVASSSALDGGWGGLAFAGGATGLPIKGRSKKEPPMDGAAGFTDFNSTLSNEGWPLAAELPLDRQLLGGLNGVLVNAGVALLLGTETTDGVTTPRLRNTFTTMGGVMVRKLAPLPPVGGGVGDDGGLSTAMASGIGTVSQCDRAVLPVPERPLEGAPLRLLQLVPLLLAVGVRLKLVANDPCVLW